MMGKWVHVFVAVTLFAHSPFDLTILLKIEIYSVKVQQKI